MKSLICSMLVLCAAGLLALGGSSPAAPSPTFAAAALKCDNPACDCQSCECVTCTCAPLQVGSPPDLLALSNGSVVEEKFTQPPPGLIVPIAHPVSQPVKCDVQSPPAAAGHWEARQSCGRGGCSVQQVWVPHAAQAPAVAQQSACGAGGCRVRRGLFGRRR